MNELILKKPFEVMQTMFFRNEGRHRDKYFRKRWGVSKNDSPAYMLLLKAAECLFWIYDHSVGSFETLLFLQAAYVQMKFWNKEMHRFKRGLTAHWCQVLQNLPENDRSRYVSTVTNYMYAETERTINTSGHTGVNLSGGLRRMQDCLVYSVCMVASDLDLVPLVRLLLLRCFINQW